MSAALRRVELKHPPAEVEFKGLFKVRLLLGVDGRKRVVPGEIAGELGLAERAMRTRVMRSFRKGGIVMILPSSGGPQATLTLELKYLPALLVGIEVSRVRKEIRPRLEEIQDELYEALAAYTFDGAAVNPAFLERSALDARLEAQIDERIRAQLQRLRRKKPAPPLAELGPAMLGLTIDPFEEGPFFGEFRRVVDMVRREPETDLEILWGMIEYARDELLRERHLWRELYFKRLESLGLTFDRAQVAALVTRFAE